MWICTKVPKTDVVDKDTRYFFPIEFYPESFLQENAQKIFKELIKPITMFEGLKDAFIHGKFKITLTEFNGYLLNVVPTFVDELNELAKEKDVPIEVKSRSLETDYISFTYELKTSS